MVQGLGFSRGLEKTGFWLLRFILFWVSPDSGFEVTSKKRKNPDKAITRISNFSGVPDSMQMIPQGGGGTFRPPPPWGILAFSRNREVQIRVRALSGLFYFFHVSSKPESGETENNRNWRNWNPVFSNPLEKPRP